MPVIRSIGAQKLYTYVKNIEIANWMKGKPTLGKKVAHDDCTQIGNIRLKEEEKSMFNFNLKCSDHNLGI